VASRLSIVEQYIAAMRTAHSFGSHTAETTFYTPLANVLNAVGENLKPRVVFVAHPGSRGAGLPDGGLFPVAKKSQVAPLPNQRPERGAVEIKPPGESLAHLAQSPQVRRYLTEYGLCLITNYHQFQLVELRHGQPSIMESYDLAHTADDLWHLPITQFAKRHAETFPDFLARVLTRKVPLEKPKDVAELFASYAREARERAAEHPIVAFDGVKSALQESLGITFEGDKGEHFFRSTLIQTLFYGIFSAWILWRRSPDYASHNGVFNWRLSADYLRVAVLGSLFNAVTDRNALNTIQITEVLDHATDALNRVQPDFFTTFREEDAVQYFYEPFLEAFDPELRKQLGVWYTPREIVRYMVERVDHLLRTELHEPLGLASPNVQVLDPCCGTGAYLVEVLHRIERTLRQQAGDDDALVGSDLRRAATTRIFGFEIMPAPFVIAHLQIAQLLEDARASLSAMQRAQVFLTNALTGWVPARHPQSNFGFPAFTDERDAAEAVKQADTILVILGNPPYNGYAGIAQIEEERGLTNAYRTPVPGLTAPQGQGLNDLYVRFFRIAERRIVGDAHAKGNSDGRGLVSFISNNAWLDGLSHVSMRARYLKEFQSIYVDNLNGDKYRTGKTTPDGKPDPSAFSTPHNREGIQVGTAIATLVRNTRLTAATTPSANGATIYQPGPKAQVPDHENPRAEGPTYRLPPAESSSIHLRNLWGTQKLSQLDREADPAYSAVTTFSGHGLPFADRVHNPAYGAWPRLPELFPFSSTGITSSRDPLVISIDRDLLLARIKRYLSAEADAVIGAEFPSAMKPSARFDPFDVRASLQTRGFREWQVLRYCYRPFDLRWIYWEPTTKLLDEKRRDFVKHLMPWNIWIEARQKEISAFTRGSVSRELCDHFGNGPSNFFPFVVFDEPDLIFPDGPPVMNLSDAAGKYVERLIGGTDSEERSRAPLFVPTEAKNLRADYTDPFFHALAIMHTPQYRTENSGALLGDWPRIPLPATAELLTHSATLGRRLAELLDPESDINLAAEWSFLARLSIAAEFPEGTPDRDRRNAARFALTAGWGGRGQGDTVMPRRGKAPERDWTPAELERLAALAASLGSGPDARHSDSPKARHSDSPDARHSDSQSQNLRSSYHPITLDDTLRLLGPRCVDVYLNDAAFWTAVPIHVWEYTLGGYQVLKKWLSYREEPLLGRPLHEDEARYFAQVVRRIAAILLMGPALDASYAAILPTALGLPGR
jgi:hypothetical protein